MELSKQDTKMLQGLSVLAMLCLHLFDRLEWDGMYTPLIYVCGVPLTYIMGQISDFCVMGFAFVTGYAHIVQSGAKEFYGRRLKSLLALLFDYWIVLAVFCLVSIAAGQGASMPGSIDKFIGNALLFNITYNGAWWYMYAYVLLVLLCPLLIKAIQKFRPSVILCAGFALYCFSYYVRFHNDGSWLHCHFGPFGMTVFEYLIGAEFAHNRWMSKFRELVCRLKPIIKGIIAVVLIVGMLVGHAFVVRSLFVAPITGTVIICLFVLWEKPTGIQQFFNFIGGHSTNIWLSHMFFYLVLFEGLVWIGKYPVCVYLLMLGITLMVSILLRPIQGIAHKLIK